MACQPDPALLEEGWVQRFVTDRARAEEAVAHYGELGFETRLVSVVHGQVDPECALCAPVLCAGYVHVYTRRREAGPARGDPGAPAKITTEHEETR